MLRELRAHRLLQGLRGRPPADAPALVDMIVRLSWLAADLGTRIAELDVNPVIVHAQGRGATIVDGWLRLD